MRSFAALLTAVCLLMARAALGADVEVLHYEPLADYVVSDAATGTAKPAVAGRVELSFIAFGRKFGLELERNPRLDALRAQLDLPAGVVAYRGKLAERSDSWVRIVMTPAGPSGLVWDGSELYGIETPIDTAAAAAVPVVFRLADVYVAPTALACSSAPPASMSGTTLLQRIAAETTALEQQGATLNLDLGAVADFEFQQIFGSNSASAVVTRLNNVDGIFSEQLGVQLSVAAVDVFAAAADPFTETDAEGLLDELAIYRGATPAQDALGLTYLFTGRDLDGTTVGIAYVGAVCSRRAPFDPLQRSFGVGLSEATRGTAIDSLIAAHEIGHNFGAPHDAQAGSPCESTLPTFLMAPSVNGSDRFSECSIGEIQAELAAATCLTPIGGADMAIAASGPQSTLLGASFDYMLNATNVGTVSAGSVELTASFATGLTLSAAMPSAGACAIDSQSVTCGLGDVAAGAARSVRLTFRAAAVGASTIAAAVASAADTTPANDFVTKDIDVLPAVDLVLSGTIGSVQTQQQTTLPVTLNNVADFGANGIVVAISLSNGLRADSATLGGAACAISGQSATCPAESLGARTSASLLLTLTALSSGMQQISLGASAAEAELVPSDNTLVLALDVTERPAATEAGGGGGAADWLALAALGFAALLRRRSRALIERR